MTGHARWARHCAGSPHNVAKAGAKLALAGPLSQQSPAGVDAAQLRSTAGLMNKQLGVTLQLLILLLAVRHHFDAFWMLHLQIWDTHTGDEMHILEGHKNVVGAGNQQYSPCAAAGLTACTK